MIQLKTFLLGTDKTTIVKVYCIKVLKSTKNRIALLGDVIIICVNTINVKKFYKLKATLQKRYYVGSMHRALVVRTKTNYHRVNNILLKFNENSIVVVSKQVVPMSNKVYGPILREFCMR
jgi:large subunit ribosomal protein L14